MTYEHKTTRENIRTRFEGIPCWEWISDDNLDALGWPLTFIWAGVVLLLTANLGFSDEQGWSLFFLGAGALVLIAVAVRLLVPGFRRTRFGDLIWAGILFGLGTGWGLLWAVILIAVGASLLLGGYFRDQEYY